MIRMSAPGSWLILIATLANAAPDAPGTKRLIVTGWDNPTSAQFANWTATACGGPFDGAVIEPVAGGRRPFRAAWSATPWTGNWPAEVAADLRRGLRPGMTDVFLGVHANPGDVDWFDDAGWTRIVEHWRIAARIARAGGARGLVFDPEPYSKPYAVFKYSAQSGRAIHDFSAYRAKVRERGREVMRAVAGEFPDAVILSYFLLSICLEAKDVADLARFPYGLLPAFLEGWMDAAPPKLRIVDGCEPAYEFTDPAEYRNAADRIKGEATRLIDPAVRAAYGAHVEVGFGLYLDAHVKPPNPDRLQACVRAAVGASDRYVWIYGERGRWWPPVDAEETEDGKLHEPWPRVIPGLEEILTSAVDSGKRMPSGSTTP